MGKNIPGEFFIEIDDKEYTLKMTYGVAEKLETRLLGKSLMELLTESLNGRARLSDIVTVFHACLEVGDKKQPLDKEQLGDGIMRNGLKKYASAYTRLLTYAMTGDEEPKTERIDSKKK
jgi:dissimilatory sulfite reductase (desulfoviridin) alpha/beta subunit